MDGVLFMRETKWSLGSYTMYTYMIKQRKKTLGSGRKVQ
jgi:hypothetical protein